MIKKAIVKVIVYFDDEEVDERLFSEADLGEIGHAYTFGPCVGQHEVESIEAVEGEALREGLRAIGNDGTFFDHDATASAA